jgi:TolB-like protein/Flp pilus assembly protein TadD
MITVQLLGGASLRAGDALIEGPPAQRHRVALLTLIVAAWPQPLSRDRAMALLWPERDTANARRLLNLAVHVLRSALGDDALASTASGLVWNPAAARCDLHDLRAAMSAGDAERVARLYTGPLLDGFHLPESADFAYWLDTQRDELSHAFTSALLALAERQARSGDVRGRVTTCRRLVAVDPHSSAYAQALMRALDAAGERSAAIQHASEHAQRVRTDLDLDADPAVMALADELRTAPATRIVATGAPATRTTPSVAVLPFLNLSGDPETEYFADGVTEDVIAHLSKIRALTVIARTSVTPFRARHQSPREIADRLGASAVLDGSVRRAGDRARVVATLIDAQSDRHLWAETYDRQLTDIFSVQTDLALQIAAALKAELTRDEQARVRREPTRDVQAYRLFLEGRQAFIKFTPESLARAIELFDRAIARDPSFALAHAHIAMAYIELAEGGELSPELAYRPASDAAAASLRLDPELGAAHCTVAFLEMTRDFDWAGAERDFKRALELSPSGADAHDLYGRLCAALGRHDDAIALLRRAQELDPLAHRVDLVTALIRAGRYDEAIVSGEQAVELDAADDRARATLGWAYFLSGRREDGIAELERAVNLSHRRGLWLGQLGEAYGLAGRTAEARAILVELEARARSGHVSPYHFAYVYAGLGESDQAIDWLERAVADRAGPTYGLRGSFLFSALHGHPRFQALLERMKLA